jgi:integrase/recombinase XerD
MSKAAEGGSKSPGRSPGELQAQAAGGDGSSLYATLVVPYIEFVRHHRGRRTTHQLEYALGRFFSWLEGRGVGDLRQLAPAQLRDFGSSLKGFRPSTIAVEASALRGFLAYLHLQGTLEVNLASVVERPRVYQMSTPPQILDQDTVERLLAAVDRSTALGKRDYAMLLLAARYGLRPGDIRGLRFDSIHWREQRIALVLSKSQRQLELPLLADIDEALVDYICQGRPPCPAREIFVRHVAPVGPLARRNNLWPVMFRALRAARIEVRGERGLRLLRHCAATRMLRAGVPFDTISDVLGHGSVEVTRRYAQVDLDGLRSVALAESEVRS